MSVGGRLMLPLILVGAISGSSFAQRMERGSFLRKPALSRWQLLEQVKRDPIVAARYHRHFHVSDQELLAYFGTLQTSTLSATQKYRVWHVDPDGKIGPKYLLLKKGTKVFVDPKGKLVLKLSCGNPMTETIPKRPKEFEPTVNRIPPTTLEAPVGPELELAPTEPPGPALDVPVEPPPIEPAGELTPAGPIYESSAPQIFMPSGGGSIAWWPILTVPVIGTIIPKGGGDAVPEPTTMAVFATGIGWAVARRRRKGC